MHFNLDKIFDLNKWQDLQDSIADIIQMAIITIDYKGKPITCYSKCTPFCQKIRSDTDLRKMCQKCDSSGGLEAARNNKPYIYLCHFNIISIAIPITNDDKYIGALMAGQVRPLFPGNAPELEIILYSPSSLNFLRESHELTRLYEDLPTLDYEIILRGTNMLFKLCNYIIEEANVKNMIENMNSFLTQSQQITLPDMQNFNNIPYSKPIYANTSAL